MLQEAANFKWLACLFLLHVLGSRYILRLPNLLGKALMWAGQQVCVVINLEPWRWIQPRSRIPGNSIL
jgi:hypothetical protein